MRRLLCCNLLLFFLRFDLRVRNAFGNGQLWIRTERSCRFFPCNFMNPVVPFLLALPALTENTLLDHIRDNIFFFFFFLNCVFRFVFLSSSLSTAAAAGVAVASLRKFWRRQLPAHRINRNHVCSNNHQEALLQWWRFPPRWDAIKIHCFQCFPGDGSGNSNAHNRCNFVC